MPRTIGEYERKNQTSPVSPEGGIERLRQIEINNELAELKALARKVAEAWTSDRSGVELIAEQRR